MKLHDTMFEAYIDERYGDNLKIDWREYLNRFDLTCHKNEYGFVAYKLQGDAAIVNDIYVLPQFRKPGHPAAWSLHNYVLKHAKLACKRVMIGFSDFMGKNHKAGIKAMTVAGFVPAFDTTTKTVFVKGI